MDAFVKITPQKKKITNTLHQREIDLLKEYIKEGKNVIICGSSGVGKSYVLNAVLDESNSIEIDTDFKVRDELKNSNMNIFVEDYRHDVISQRQLIEFISEGGRLSKGSFVVCTLNMFLLPNFETILIPKRNPDLISTLKPCNTLALTAAIRCKGNLHNFFDYIQFSHDKDVFVSPKDFAISILCTDDTIDATDAMSEHGHIWGMVHENYVDSPNVDMARVAMSLSDADLYDTNIYKGNWESMPYFIHAAVMVPKFHLNGCLNEETIRPGSFWTKYGNYKMRYQKYRNINIRIGSGQHQELALLREYARSGDMDTYTSCGLTSQDFDVINHLALCNKLKSREVSQIKKKIKDYIK
jgi:hypothetical protein